MTLDDLKTAIEMRAPVEFDYAETPGGRVGNPHAIFVYRKKDGTESTKVHIEQTAGVSKSETPFPSFRMFDLDQLTVLSILKQDAPFQVSSKYNPEWEHYQFAIAKV